MKSLRRFLSISVLALLLAGGTGNGRRAVALTADCSRIVAAAAGPITGQAADTAGVCSWKGIPYAAPPVGPLRWRPPVPAPAWTKTRAADRFRDKCVQLGLFDRPGKAQPKGSEDCLYLNVWGPRKSGPFPVMVWIHGGGLMSGAGDSIAYTGDKLAAAGDVVVVSFNYRLGVMGFLAHPDFQKEDPDHAVGGYGMMDQIAALVWVKNNIAAFGGDPDNVTIFGESAGGWSVCQLLASPAAAGLFHRAIQESGGCNRTRTLDQGFAVGNDLAAQLGCPGDNAAECLRAKSVQDIMRVAPWNTAGDGMPFRVHEDGVLLTKMPIDLIREGNYNHVPFLAGSNRDEYKLFAILEPDLPNLTREQYVDRVKKERGAWADRFLSAYPADDFASPYEAYITLESDRNPGCGAHDPIAALAADQAPVFYYRFDFDDIPLASHLGAFHGLELLFVFGSFEQSTIGKLLGPQSRELAAPLSRTMQAYWTNFARHGDPNGPGLPDWPAYDQDHLKIILDSDRIAPEPEPAKQFSRCELWDQYVREVERK